MKPEDYQWMSEYRRRTKDDWIFDAYGEAKAAVNMFKNNAEKEDLEAQLLSFSKVCVWIYADDLQTDELKKEIKYEEWRLYDCILWENESNQDFDSILDWWNEWMSEWSKEN